MTFQDLWHRLTPVYDDGEAKAIVRLVLESRFGLSMSDIYVGKVNELSPNDNKELAKIMLRLEKAEPVQYVLGTADFHGYTYKVEQGVLIPRPETAELADWVVADLHATAAVGSAQEASLPSVLDVGTGSGCIAITLALLLKRCIVTAWDIAPAALRLARENALQHGVAVEVVEQDIFTAPADRNRWDVIVSNPPYIARREQRAMNHNVLGYEPEVALFVPDDDPLKFYRAIATYAAQSLKRGGRLFFEINPVYAEEMCDLLAGAGFTDIEIRNDQFGRQRMMRGVCGGCR